ncbi:MAG TPA: hypothetical protein VF541_06540 [Longimicrobium sp.]|jgi:hypothetical protein
MKKLALDTLAVESFPTTPKAAGPRGTIDGRENTGGTTPCENTWPPDTCPVTCAETCTEPCMETPVC